MGVGVWKRYTSFNPLSPEVTPVILRIIPWPERAL